MPKQKRSSSRRQIDETVSRANQKLKSKFVLVPSMEIKAWKGLIIIMFVVGFFAALTWSVYNSWYIGSDAKMETMPTSVIGGVIGGPVPISFLPFTIGKVNVASTTANSATITWRTTMPAVSTIEYGKNTRYGSQTTTDGDGTHMNFTMTLGQLDANTTYHFRVKARDIRKSKKTDTAVTADYTFKTKKDVVVFDPVSKTESVTMGYQSRDIVLYPQPFEIRETKFSFKGKGSNYPGGKAEAYQDGKLTNSVRISKDGSWEIPIEVEKKEATYKYQIRFLDKNGKVAYSTSVFSVNKK